MHLFNSVNKMPRTWNYPIQTDTRNSFISAPTQMYNKLQSPSSSQGLQLSSSHYPVFWFLFRGHAHHMQFRLCINTAHGFDIWCPKRGGELKAEKETLVLKGKRAQPTLCGLEGASLPFWQPLSQKEKPIQKPILDPSKGILSFSFPWIYDI